MLSGISSDHTNLLTSTRLYCAIPRMICMIAPLLSDAPIRSTPFRTSFKHRLMDNRDWTTACGNQCPALVRKSTTDKGIASFLWNEGYKVPASNFEDTDYLLGQHLLCWRFGRCRNVNCKNYQPILNHIDCRFETDRIHIADAMFWRFN